MQFIRNNNVSNFQTQQEQCSMLIFEAAAGKLYSNQRLRQDHLWHDLLLGGRGIGGGTQVYL